VFVFVHRISKTHTMDVRVVDPSIFFIPIGSTRRGWRSTRME
jgi:hypothetical protein